MTTDLGDIVTDEVEIPEPAFTTGDLVTVKNRRGERLRPGTVRYAVLDLLRVEWRYALEGEGGLFEHWRLERR